METQPATTKYKNPRFPIEIISHAVWLYFRFCLSFRDVEELLFERGVVVTYEAIRKWCRKFGQPYANQQVDNALWYGSFTAAPTAARHWHPTLALWPLV